MDSKILEKDNIQLVLYRENCVDAFCALAVVYKYFKLQNKLKKIEFIPFYHHHSYDMDYIKGKHILMLDFCYTANIMKEIIENCGAFKLLASSNMLKDHHKPIEIINVIPDKFKTFDIAKTVCVLTWNYIFPDTEMPLLYEWKLWKIYARSENIQL